MTSCGFRNNTWRWKFTWGCGWGHFFFSPFLTIPSVGSTGKEGVRWDLAIPGTVNVAGKNRLAVRLWAGISYMAYHCENASTFPSLFNPQHHPMKHENELGVLASFLDLLPLISMSPHSWFLSFVLWFPFSLFFIAVFLLGSQVKFCCSPEFHSLSCSFFSLWLFKWDRGWGWVVAEKAARWC